MTITDKLAQALRLFIGAAYPVHELINPRGHNWSQAYLDGALAEACATLAEYDSAPPAGLPSLPEPIAQPADREVTRRAQVLVPLNFDQLQSVMAKHFGGRELTDEEADSAEEFARAVERAHGIAHPTDRAPEPSGASLVGEINEHLKGQ